MVDHIRSAKSGRGVEEAEGERLAPISASRETRRFVRRRRAGRILWLLARVAAVATLLGGKFVVCNADKCLGAKRNTKNGQLIVICAREYEATGDPKIGLEYARALYREGHDELASQLATSFLVTPVQSDALTLLGRIARRDERYDDARAALERARDLHRAERRMSAVAEDEQALATVLSEDNDFAGALRMLDRCIADANAAADRRMEGYCYLQAGQTLSAIGLFDGARRAVEAAAPLLEEERDRAALDVERGNRAQDDGLNADAASSAETPAAASIV
jgi:tetratricopeptide (TPR) repeat protein